MGLFRKAWEHKDPKKREEGVRQELNDQEKLKQIALTDQYVEVRQAAIGKLTDDAFFVQYLALLANVDDTPVTLALASTICNRIAEPRLLTVAACKLKSERYAEICFARLQSREFADHLDPQTWLRIMKDSPHGAIKKGAAKMVLKKSADNALLIEILPYLENSGDRKAVADKIDDRDALTRLSLNDDAGYVRETAIERLGGLYPEESQGVFKRIVTKDEKQDVRCAAARKIRDQLFLRGIFRDKKIDAVLRKAAVAAVSDDDLLKEIVRNDEDAQVREEALAKIRDQRFLKDFIGDEQNSITSRLVALGAVSDDEYLYGIANADDIAAAKIAVRRILDAALLERIAREHPDVALRLASFSRLPCANKAITSHFPKLLPAHHTVRYSRRRERFDAASGLLKSLKDNPRAASVLWATIDELSAVPHSDSVSHDDNGQPRRSHDCCYHDDINTHTDLGIGINFPPYPFAD